MLVCESPSRSLPRSFPWIGIALILALGPASLCAEFPASRVTDAETPWSDEFPRVETRISWGWPAFLSFSRPSFAEDNEQPVSLPPAKNSFGPLFGRIDWLSPHRPQAVTVSADSLIFRSQEPRFSVPWFSRPTESDFDVTLVRGGVPQLFGARMRLRGEYGDEFDDVKRIRGQMLLNLIGNHIGIDASVDSWEDNRPAPKSLGDFWTGDANLVYSMGAQRIAMRGGLGTSWVYDRDLDVGYNFTYGADLFLTRPWLVSAEVDWGQINGSKLFHWRGTFGVQLFLMEIYIGYDSYKWDRIRFDGPVVGAGVWF